VEGAGWGRGKKGAHARKPLDYEKPVRPRTGLLIGGASITRWIQRKLLKIFQLLF